MAEKLISEVYYYSNIVSKLREIATRYRYQEDYRTTLMFKRLLPGVERAYMECASQNYEEKEYLKEKLQSLKDLAYGISLADTLENAVIPVMERWLQTWISVDEQMDDRYRIESTASGFLTIKDVLANRYLHSNHDPMEEARRNIERWIDYSKDAYIVWGCGLGYHAYQLYRFFEGAISITIYEPNVNLLRYALQYGVLSWIPKENLSIISGCSGEEFIKNIKNSDGVFLLRPYVDTMQNEYQKGLLLKYIVDNIGFGKKHYLSNIPKISVPIESFQYAYTISLLRQVVDYCYVLDEEYARELLQILEKSIEDFLKACAEDEYSEADELSEIFRFISESKDIVLIGDMLDGVAIPIMERWMQQRDSIDKVLDDRYKLEPTGTGYLTIKDISANACLHSSNDPMNEARMLLERQYDDTWKNYSVWGCGLGYHIYQLYVFSQGTIPIRVYEPNPKMVEYAYQYGVLSWIPKELLEIIYVKDAEEFFTRIDGGKLFLNTYIQMDNNERRNKLNAKFSRYLFGFEAERYLKLNYYQNMRLGVPYVSAIDHRKLKKEMVVVGGGPSLDHYMDTLKSWQGKKTIIVAGTVWKKLLRAGIRPNFVVIMDPYDEVYPQVENIEDTSATLLLALQAHCKVGKDYKGKKYIIPHRLLIDEIDEQLKETGETLYFSGGSVTVFELEFAIRMFADKVYLLGVDLSLPGGMSHAEGTEYRTKLDVSELIPMEDVNGNTVYTDHALIESISWFETIMAETEGIEYINMSDVGVKLKGTKLYQGKPDRQ